VRINGTGKQTRDYVFVSDIVAALLLALEHPEKTGPYHVGSGIETDVCTLFKKVSRLTGYKDNPLTGPADVGAPLRSALDSGKLRRDFGWKPKISLNEGLKKTVSWFKKNA
jgi:UDP-glucose 4-epimerase